MSKTCLTGSVIFSLLYVKCQTFPVIYFAHKLQSHSLLNFIHKFPAIGSYSELTFEEMLMDSNHVNNVIETNYGYQIYTHFTCKYTCIVPKCHSTESMSVLHIQPIVTTYCIDVCANFV